MRLQHSTLLLPALNRPIKLSNFVNNSSEKIFFIEPERAESSRNKRSLSFEKGG